MLKSCSKCEKTVYPTEELKCLDKTWHKACFRCWDCGMTLNMKNYKGYNKLPYCNAHYPTTKFTAVAETPELQRLAANSKIQSNIQYHGEFEKSKGKYTSVVDDPETLRILKNQKEISLVKYHADFEKMKGSKISVSDEPEMLRVKKNTATISNIEYHGLKERAAEMESARAHIDSDGNVMQPPQANRPVPTPQYIEPPEENTPSPYQARHGAGTSTVYNSQGKVESVHAHRNIGSISNYDPMNERHGSLTQGYQPANSGQRMHEWEETVQVPGRGQQQQQQRPAESYQPPPPQPQAPPEPPIAVPIHEPVALNVHHQEQDHYPAPNYNQPPPAQKSPPAPASGPMYKAIYDYERQDDDEVSFLENDIIIDPDIIDEGWMFGTVKRTGKRGMLPANYVEKI